MNKQEMKESRRALHQIYVDHDIPKFREFVTKLSAERPALVAVINAKDEVLSDLMHTMKSQLIYLGEDWQKSRNLLRMKQFWSGKTFSEESEIPLCVGCQYFREGPSEEEPACMHLGATPEDIYCPAYKPLK